MSFVHGLRGQKGFLIRMMRRQKTGEERETKRREVSPKIQKGSTQNKDNPIDRGISKTRHLSVFFFLTQQEKLFFCFIKAVSPQHGPRMICGLIFGLFFYRGSMS